MTRRLLVAAVAAALLAAGGGAVAMDGLVHDVLLRPGYASDDLLVILVIGSDVGPPHRPANPLRGRADGIHLLVTDTSAARMTIVDVPRDALIGGTKVNAHLAFGGPERLERVLEDWTGLAVDFWVLATFRSIENIVDGLGGVQIEITQPMRDRFSGTQLDPGVQRLPGWQALAFVRDRKSLPDGDIGRSRNQGRLIHAALVELRARFRDPPALLEAVGLLARNTVSNIPPQDLLPLALLATRIDPSDVAQVTISGPIGSAGGQSVVLPRPGDVFTRLAAGQVGP